MDDTPTPAWVELSTFTEEMSEPYPTWVRIPRTWAQPLPRTRRGSPRPWEDVVVPGERPAFVDEYGTLVIARCERWR